MDAIERLIDALQEKAEAYRDVVKLGRTQLQDAVPVRAGQMFCAWADVLRREKKRLQCARERMLCIHLGGTAVGTGLAASAAYLQKVVPALTEITGLPLYRSDNCIDATQNADDYVALSAALRGGASSLSKICNDIRLLSSGPSGGLGELLLPVRQNGSSIMPGKVNPVIPEVVNQVAFRIVGFDVTVAMAAEAGQLELNAFEPVIFDSLYQGCTQLCRAILSLERHCIRSMTVNQERCAELVEHSSAMATRLVPQIGYSEACLVACEAQQKRKTVRCVAVEKGLMNEEEAERIFDPLAMTDALETTTCI